jgi:YhcH/YjgK/YiaL family protein
LADGRHDIDGDDIYALVMKGTGRTRGEAELEVHRKYIDVQCIISGRDDIGWQNYSACKNSKGGYNSEEDLELLADSASAWITICPGDFAILFPEDAHAPGVGEGEFHKVVVKVVV